MKRDWIIVVLAGGFLLINSAIQFVVSSLFYMNETLVFYWFDLDHCVRLSY